MPDSEWAREFDRRVRAARGIPDGVKYEIKTDYQGWDTGGGGGETVVVVEWPSGRPVIHPHYGRASCEFNDFGALIRHLDAVPPAEVVA